MGRLTYMDASLVGRFSEPQTPDQAARSWRQLTVDFYLYSGHEIAVWESLWRCLRQRGIDAEFVLEPPGRHTAIGSVPDPKNGWANDLDGKIEPLVDRRTHDSMVNTLDSLGLTWIDRSRPNADAVITTQGVGWLEHYNGLRIKTEYGACAFVDVYGHGAINEGLDAVLAHGPFSARAISAHLPSERVHIVGYPKWATAHRDGLTREAAREALELSPDTPVVAWLPTWAHNATIDQYSDALGQLAETYQVVAKPHHNSVRFETERLAAADPRIVIRQDLHSLVPLMIAADVVVADSRSGALAETFIADRPAVGLLPGIAAREHGLIAGLDDAVVWCREPEDLSQAVANALGVDRSQARRRWRNWLFADVGGDDDMVAAQTIISLVQPPLLPTSGLPPEALDSVIDATDATDPKAFMNMFARIWALWPGHPRLIDLIHRVRPFLESVDLIACARLVRESDQIDACPVRATARDNRCDPVERLVAAAISAVVFEDTDAVATFCERVDATPATEFEEAFTGLDLVPDAIPAFVRQAATSADRCRDLASALTLLGAGEEAILISDYGKTLVNS